MRDDPRYHADALPGALPRGLAARGGGRPARRASRTGLPDGLGLVVWDGYRPIATQAALYGSYLEELTMVHPDWPADALEEAAARYVTPPSRSPRGPAAPPHRWRGGPHARRRRRAAHPLGTDFDAFVPEAATRGLEETPGRARDLRRILFWAMNAEGFTSYHEEWWHFDYGDQFWGLVTGRAAIYGAADAPE